MLHTSSDGCNLQHYPYIPLQIFQAIQSVVKESYFEFELFSIVTIGSDLFYLWYFISSSGDKFAAIQQEISGSLTENGHHTRWASEDFLGKNEFKTFIKLYFIDRTISPADVRATD